MTESNNTPINLREIDLKALYAQYGKLEAITATLTDPSAELDAALVADKSRSGNIGINP